MMMASEKRGSMEMRKWGTTPPLPRPTWAATARPRTAAAAAVKSVTREEIERFWRRKRMQEEDHLLAAVKAAARIRARTLKEEEYRQFEASLEGILNSSRDTGKNTGSNEEAGTDDNKELRAVIRDWWTKSKYAYLNQPAIQSMEPEAAAKRSTYIPNACFYAAAVSPKPCAALGVF